MSKTNKTGAFVGGMIIGGAIGTLVGLSIAPRSGKETRQILKKSVDALPELAEDLSSSLQLQADKLSGSALRKWQDTLERLKEAIAAGIEASQLQAKEMERSKEMVATNAKSNNNHL
jgi:gas vesicle protein